jgi:hypothetical protein
LAATEKKPIDLRRCRCYEFIDGRCGQERFEVV